MTTRRKANGPIAREYGRVSLDRSGKARSIGEQHDENVAAAADHGWILGEAYADNDRSASRYATKAREGFDQLIVDLEKDRFGAQVLILWESSRGSRKVSEWVRLLELCEQRAVKIHVTTHGRTYDPANGRDRRSILEDAIDSEYESSKVHTRTTRTNAARAAQGLPHGRVPYGFERVYDPHTKRLVEQRAQPEESKVVRELFKRLLKGDSLHGIARDFASRGVLTRQRFDKDGGPLPRVPFSPAHLRSLAMSAAYAGIREHQAGRKSRSKLSEAPLTKVDGTWQGLVSKRDFLSVQRILTDPSRKTSRPGRGIHLVSMIARCAVCGGPLAVTYRDIDRAQYFCRNSGHVRVSKPEVDEIAEAAILGYLERADVYEKLTTGDESNDQLEALQDELADLRTRLDELADGVASGAVSVALAARAEVKILAQIKDIEERQAELATPSVLRSLVGPGADVRARWARAEMSSRREVARMLLVPGLLGTLAVNRSPSRGHQVPATERVEFLGTSGAVA